MGGQRWTRCARCKQYRPNRPIYERVYDRDGKSGRFVRAFWLCDDCFAELSKPWVPATGQV